MKQSTVAMFRKTSYAKHKEHNGLPTQLSREHVDAFEWASMWIGGVFVFMCITSVADAVGVWTNLDVVRLKLKTINESAKK